MRIWTGSRVSAVSERRHVRFYSVFALFALAVSPALAQRPGSGSNSGSAPSRGAGSAGSSANVPGATNFPGTRSNLPGSTTNRTSGDNWPGSRPIFLSGQVLFSDGIKPNNDIRIERVCKGQARLEGHTDSKGRFSFQVGQNGTVDTDAADQLSGRSSAGTYGSGGGFGSNSLWDCELRASYPGYRSDLVELSGHRSNDDPNVGTIILHRLGGDGAGTISLTTALVPKRAQKDYDKGVELAEKEKFQEAEKRFLAATAAYPKYAIAWFALGQAQQREGKAAVAKTSYEAAIAADARYASPYDQLALLSAQGQDWEATAKYSQQAISLDRVNYPSSLWYNALANLNLRKPEEAEKSLRELLRSDKAHRYPEAERMYAQLLITKGSYQEAATHLHTYLAIAPQAQGAASAKEQLAKLDQASSIAGK